MPGAPDDPSSSGEIRASDADRDRVVSDLGAHAAAGRLTLAELEHRAGLALVARSRGELERIVRDLPSAPAPDAERRATRWLVSLMGGSDRRGRWRVGRRLTTIAVMGGNDLDLREAEIAGPTTTIVAVAVMGGIDVYVPDTVEVDLGGLALMGGNDQRGSVRPPREGAPLVRVRAYSLLGGVDVWRLPAEARGRRLRDARRAAKALEP